MSAWMKTVNLWDLRIYEHESGKVRVVRHARSRSFPIKDGRYTVGRASHTTTWSTVSVRREMLVELGVLPSVCATGESADWICVDSTEITSANLLEAKQIGEEIVGGKRNLVCVVLNLPNNTTCEHILMKSPDFTLGESHE